MSIPQLFLPVTKMQIQEVRQKIINVTNIFHCLIIQGTAQFALIRKRKFNKIHLSKNEFAQMKMYKGIVFDTTNLINSQERTTGKDGI